MASIATYKKYPERKLESLKNLHCNSSQETVNTDSVSQNVNNQQPVDDVIDLNSHVANCHLLINGNCEPDNRITLENSPKNVENIIGDCNNLGMCVEKQKCIAPERHLSCIRVLLCIGKIFLPYLKHMH